MCADVWSIGDLKNKISFNIITGRGSLEQIKDRDRVTLILRNKVNRHNYTNESLLVMNISGRRVILKPLDIDNIAITCKVVQLDNANL